MDLFDKIKKKTSDAFDYTRDKAYNISEEIRIRGLINESKEKVSNFYREIGKIVFENVKNERGSFEPLFQYSAFMISVKWP